MNLNTTNTIQNNKTTFKGLTTALTLMLLISVFPVYAKDTTPEDTTVATQVSEAETKEEKKEETKTVEEEEKEVDEAETTEAEEAPVEETAAVSTNANTTAASTSQSAAATTQTATATQATTTAQTTTTTVNSTASSNPLTPQKGVVYYNGHRETYYSQKVLPGGGLDIPGRHVAEDGTVRDGEGYICVASSDYSKGTVVETSLGTAKVYDSGCASGTVDIYTNW